MDTKKKISGSLIVNIICMILNIALVIGFNIVKGMAKMYILIPLAIVWLFSIGNFYITCGNPKNKDEALDKGIGDYIAVGIIIFMIIANVIGLL